jgi:hypothetical protein
MSDFSILNKILNTKATISLEKGMYGKLHAILHEPESIDHKGYSVLINNIPENSIVINADQFPSPNAIFNSGEGICKRADFIIISCAYINKHNKNFIMFIEMKKGKGGSEGSIIKQLKGTQCLLSYCKEIGKLFFNKEDFLSAKKYEYRFISIRDIGINKKTTVTKFNNKQHNHPEDMLKISSPHNLYFKQLI